MDINELKNFKKPPQSYWMASTLDNPEYPTLTEDIKADVAIIGGGIAGILCSYWLNKKGVKSVIIEADRILQGTTGHTTAKITSQHGLIYDKIKKQLGEELARQYAEANETSIRMYEKISRENNIDCDFITQASYIYTMQDKYIDNIRTETETAASIGLKAAYLDKIPLPFDVKAAIRFDNQAQFHPRKFLIALAKHLTENGCRIFEQSRIVNIEDENGYVLITGQGKKISAEKVIIASHYPCYNKAGLYFTRIYPERSYAIGVKIKEKYPGGMYITKEDPGRSYRSQPTDDGELIIIGGEHHKTGQGVDTVQHYNALVDYAAKIYTIEDIPYRWSTQDCVTMDDIPLTGHFTQDTPNLYVSTGYGKWGMTNSMASAMILADLIVEGRSPWQDVYSPERHNIAGSVKNFVKENLNVAEKLINGKITPAADNVEIKPGQGNIIDVNGQKAGAYRDEKGKLHIVDITCTHMGCELAWNSAEKSWDCPCHGSRFTYEGDVIEGPATRRLDIHNDVNTIEKLLKDNF